MAGRVAWGLSSLLGWTLRLKIHDEAGVTDPDSDLGPSIWTLWHNRVLVVPHVRNRVSPHRYGAVLTSPSGDGAVLAETVRCFGIAAVQGSSSRGGVRAVIALTKWLKKGHDICITPDGPRGPRYHVNPGIVHLAQHSGAVVVPISVEFSSSWRLGSWDGFFVPKPFARAEITFAKPVVVAVTEGEQAFEKERLRLEAHLKSTVEEQ